MTGFARSENTHDGVSWYWELRSVNGRGLDVRTRFPPGMDALDPNVRAAVSKTLKRGNVNVSLNVQRSAGGIEVQLNEAAFQQVMKAVERAREIGDLEAPKVEAVLALKGVLEFNEVEDADDVVSARHELMLRSFDTALSGLAEAREREGQGLKKIIGEQLDEIARLVEVVTRSDARKPDAIRARLQEQVARLMDANVRVDEDRLYQEAVLLATRCDVDEELKRLEQHVSAGRALLSDSSPVGRKLDFLAQEFNREANTLCSKSNDGDVTKAGLELKVVIDQMREQVQNIE